MAEAVIVAGIRTPFVKAGGPLRFAPTQELGRMLARELLYRAEISPDEIDELICGNVGTPPDATNVGRVISLQTGIPADRIAHTICRNCASGMDSVTAAVEQIRLGNSKVVLALGVESMSNSPILWSKQFAEKLLQLVTTKSKLGKVSRMMKFRLSDLKPIFGIEQGLRDPVSGLMMGDTADKLAREFGISRNEQDEFAVESHKKAVAATKSGKLAQEMMAIYPPPKHEPIVKDIGPRESASVDSLSRMKPYFDKRYGTITVANACQITDGAAGLLLMEEGEARRRGYKPIGRIKSYAYAGCDPARMGLGPVYATHRALERAGMTLKDIELFEINEAFAAQVMACVKAMGSDKYCQENVGRSGAIGELPLDRLNVNGGAIALGHPVGATGARIILTLLKELERRDQSVGLATLCVGGGQGGATIVERN